MGAEVGNETADFAKIAAGFRNSSVFRYGNGISLEPVTSSDVKSVDYLEELIMAEKITLSDMYILEAVAFFGHADLKMVAGRLKRMAEQHPHKPIITDSDSLSGRLQTLGKYGLLWRRRYSCGGKGNIFVYTITYRGFKMYSERLDKSFHYDTGLVDQCTTRVLRSIHVGEVACIFERRLSKVADIEEWRHSSYALRYNQRLERGEYALTLDKMVILHEKYGVDLNYLITGKRDSIKAFDFNAYIANCTWDDKNALMADFSKYLWKIVTQYKP